MGCRKRSSVDASGATAERRGRRRGRQNVHADFGSDFQALTINTFSQLLDGTAELVAESHRQGLAGEGVRSAGAGEGAGGILYSRCEVS